MSAEPVAWLTGFLQSRALRAADGRPLYRYDVRDDEYPELLAAVAGGLAQKRRDDAVGALLALAVAEWWRRDYAGGEPCYSLPLGFLFRNASVSRHDFDVLASAGLRFWRRPLRPISGLNAVAFALADEGGLPVALLCHQVPAWDAFVQALVVEHELVGTTSASLLLAGRAARFLAPWLHGVVLLRQFDAMVGQILEHGAALFAAHDPSALSLLADRLCQSSLPFRPEREQDMALARDIVERVARQLRGAKDFIRVDAEVMREGAVCTMHRRLFLPRVIPTAAFCQCLGREAGSLPLHFELHLVAPGLRHRYIGSAARSEGDGSPGADAYRLDLLDDVSSPLRPPAALGAMQLVAVSRGAELSRLEPAGGLELSDAPWILEREPGDFYRVLAVGSARCQGSQVTVAVAVDARIQEDEGSTVVHVDTLTACGRRIYRLSGGAVVTTADGATYRLRTGIEREELFHYHLEGQPLQLLPAVAGGRTFVGRPRLYRVGADGAREEIAAAALRWRSLSGPQTWMPLQDECVGAGILEHRWQGHTGFRTRVEIMPETTTVAMLVSGDGGPRGGGAVHAGAYILAGSGAQEVALAPGAAGTSATINRLGGSDRFHVELEAKSVCPAFVVLALRWANGYAMGLRLPFPAVGGLFRSPDGDVLPYSAASSLAALPGMGAEAIAVGAGPPPRLLGQLFAYDSGRMTDDGPQLAESLEPAGQGRFQLDLGRVQKRVSLLLSVSDDASAAVELWIEVPGEPPGPRRKLLVTRYGAEIVQRPDGTFGIESRSGATPYTAADLEHGEVKLAAFPLDRPVERTELARHGESWSTPEECLPAGEWLVQGWFRGRPDFRPLRVSVAAGTRTATAAAPDEAPAQTAEGSGGEAPPLSLAATGLLRPGKVRRARLDDVLRTIATDATAGQWRELWPLLDGAGDLYPSAFDLFKRLSRTPEAAAMSLVLCCPGRFERLWDVLEAAPLCWAAVPVRTWMSALRRVVEAMQAELVVAELDVAARGGPLASSIATFLEWAPRRLAGLQVVADLARQELLGESPANSPLQIARHDFGRQILLQRLEESRQELIRSPAHDSAHWPTWRGLETARRGLGELPASLRGLWLSPHVGWRKSVLWAPQLAAMASALGADLSRDTVFHIHQLQEFDPSWFETAHATTLVLATAALLEEMPDRLRG